MSEKPHENEPHKPVWPDKSEIQGYLHDPNSIKREVEFVFRFHPEYGPLPFAIASNPSLDDLDDTIILLMISTAIRTLSKRHGLGEALKKVDQVAYGRIDGKRAFKIGDYSDDSPQDDDESPF